ncbi:HNH endonuclease [Eubacteriales bacterium OttesenSCG-928-K08]|nr:HNH endonuclease [Eubacteriales bacterium OttesenSCG-928-K08]
MWRWDQGRLLYFQFDVLKSIASVLVKFDGVKISDCEDLFRETLTKETGMPFAPAHYTVLRNYKRVFECAFLATVADRKLIVTDFCRELAKEDGAFSNVDDYMLSYINRFRFPFSAFDGYDPAIERVYPFCAVIKYLITLVHKGVQPNISLDEIFHLIIANHCTGFEEMSFYESLTPKEYTITDTEKRQLREMIIFISQLSILKVYDGKLWLDISNQSALDELVLKFLQPIASTPKENRLEEFMTLTRISGDIVLPTLEVFVSDISDMAFIEGKRKRVEHFRVDRSPLLRKYYREMNQRPVCHMCHMDVSVKYPWTDYMLDIHHLLPLSSSITITTKGTSLQDIVGLCPSCHRSIHLYYSKWLRKSGQDDFNSKTEAMDVYLSAIKEIA